MARLFLVTGCAGFIGSRVTALLLRNGQRVVGIDNLDGAYDPRLKRWRLCRLQRHRGFRFERVDICEADRLQAVFRACSGPIRHPELEREGFSAVLHLASREGALPSVRRPRSCFRANCLGTMNILEMCRRWSVEKLVLASTSAVYGAGDGLRLSEDCDTNRPLSPYAASKKAAEEIAHAYHRLYGLDVSVLRYFTVYGPAGRPDMSIFRFVRQIIEGECITLYGDGSQQRDFTYLTDIAAGTIAAVRPLGFETINLGGDRPLKLTAAIETIAETAGRKPLLEHRAPQRADIHAAWANIDKARRLLGWEPRVAFSEGIRRTVAWYRKNRGKAASIALD